MFNIGNSGQYGNTNTEISSAGNGNGSNQAGNTASVAGGIDPSATSRNTGNITESGLEILRSMLAGDVFTGEVTGLNGNQVILKLPGGASIAAALLENANITIGQNITFMVRENTEKMIAIRPIDTLGQENVIVGKALDAAGMIFNERNINVVKELLMQNMPIDKDTIAAMVKNSVLFPKTGLGTISGMMKLGIHITQENIQQFEAYKSYEHNISNELNKLGSSFGELLSQSYSGDNTVPAAELLKSLTSALYPENGMVPPGSEGLDAKQKLQQPQNLLQGQIAAEDIYEPINKFTNAQSRQSMADMLIRSFGNEANQLAGAVKDGNITAKQMMDSLTNLIQNYTNSGLKEKAIKKLLGSNEFKDILKQAVRDSLRITPEDVKEKDGIKDFYNRVSESLDKLSETAAKVGKDSNFEKNLNNVKNNIDFMNDLNKNLTYFQMPVKFKSGDGNGELYVYTNKKSLAAKGDNVSALLHLDMNNLGPVDIYVKLAGKNVSTNFCLESEEMLGFVGSHIDELNKKLEALGYNMTFEMKVKEEDVSQNIMSNFLNSDSNTMNTSQYVFDIKA